MDKAVKQVISIAALVVAIIFLIYGINKMVVGVGAKEIIVTQDPIDGELKIHTEPGLYNQNFGDVVGEYYKSNQYDFDIPHNEKEKLRYDSAFADPEVAQYGIKVRFNDDGDAYIFGSMRYEMPRDIKMLTRIQTEYGSKEAVERDLVKRVVNNAVFNAGPLMSSKESSAEKRSDLLWYIEDMSLRGAYKTVKTMRREKDAVTGDNVDVKYVDIVKDTTQSDGIGRQVTTSQMDKFGIIGSNFTISQIVYSPEVQVQIDLQRQLTMDIQTAKAKALEAQQKMITAEADGRAGATKSKWDQEKINATEIALAEKDLQVGSLKAKTAAQYKQEQQLKGEGDAAYKKAVFFADGALETKINAWKAVQFKFAEEFAKQKWVPEIDMSSSGVGRATGNSAQTMIDLLSVQTAKQISLDMSMKGGK